MDIIAQCHRGCWTGIHIFDHPLLLVHHVHNDNNDTEVCVSILLSVRHFGHVFSPIQWISVVMVFGGLYMEIVAKVGGGGSNNGRDREGASDDDNNKKKEN